MNEYDWNFTRAAFSDADNAVVPAPAVDYKKDQEL